MLLGNPAREELKVASQRGVLVGVVAPEDGLTRENALDELRGLVKTAGVDVVGELVQFRDTPHPAHCIGSGKLEELQQLIAATDAQLVVFDNNLSPSQGRALEQALKKPIVDRSEVILDIFATHARTYEAMLQVELAQLMYFRTRLKRMWTHLERVGGGGIGGLGAGRGPGEKQLETDRRLVDKRISELKAKLKQVEQRRERMVSLRRDQLTVSLVGYTNAGKSTLMRQVTGADVLVQDQLFATLDTRTRRWPIPGFGEVLLSDTVGFVRNLPHHLVASFRSTLEEARFADLLLHVVDASSPDAERQIRTVYHVLDDIGVSCDNMILVLNKADKVGDPSRLDVLRRHFEDTVTVSAATGEGIDQLTARVADRLGGGYTEVELIADSGNGRLFAWLAQHAESQVRSWPDEDASRVRIRCQVPKRFVRLIPGDGVKIIAEHTPPAAAHATAAASAVPPAVAPPAEAAPEASPAPRKSAEEVPSR